MVGRYVECSTNGKRTSVCAGEPIEALHETELCEIEHMYVCGIVAYVGVGNGIECISGKLPHSQ